MSRLLTAKAEDLPFPDASLDLVVCRLAAHHFRKIGDFLSEAFRVLMPGGMIGIVDNVAPDAAIVPGRTADELRHCAALFNAFKKLSDPSHVRCLGLLEWKTLLGHAGFTVTHEECLDKEIEFGTWVRRMRSGETTTVRLKEMLRDEPLRSFLKPRDTASGPDFTLKEGIILGRKPR